MRKRQFIERLREGDRFDDLFLVKSARLAETKAGKSYLVLTVMDKSGELTGPVWDDVQRFIDVCQIGNVVRLTGTVGAFQNKPQLKVDGLEAVPKQNIDLASFLPATSRDREEMALELQKIVHSVDDPFVRKLLLKFFRKGACWDNFQEAPAAKGIHHAYIGGLLEHTLSVAQIADLISGHYQGIDRSLLLAGALFHDIGKLYELTMDRGVVNYTNQGRLKGHLVIGSEMVGRAAAEIDGFPDDLLQKIQHLILSHHGRQEYGSPTVPMMVEAFLLSFLDDLDAKMNVTEQLRQNIDAGDMEWTEYQRSLERSLFLKGLSETSKRESEVDDPSVRQQSLF